jgi:hypothetical protein
MVTNERGFTLVEFLIAALITTSVLGGTVMLASQLQQAYTTQLDDVTVEEEARFSLDWIEQALRNTGSNPYDITAAGCAAATFTPIEMDPDGDGLDDDIRIHADVSPPNGLLGGAAGVCADANEDLTIAYDDANMAITKRDNNLDMAAVTMTEPVITSLVFEYLDSSRNVTANPNAVTYVRVRVTGQSATKQNLYEDDESDFTTTTLETEVHIRTR